MLLDNLRLVLIIGEKGSLVAAAREFGMSTTIVSERLAAPEAHYGVVSFARTTRSISLIGEGRKLVNGAKSVLSEVAELDPAFVIGQRRYLG
jgi:DNA-binding transcriptional LysR family regulator